MSKNTNQKTSLTLDGFRGIDCRAEHTDGRVAADLVNFRIRADGSLEKRSGFRFLTDLKQTVRAFYPSISQGKDIAYVLCLDTVYTVDLTTGKKTALGSVATQSGDACFFFYKSQLYLMDSEELYVYQDGELLLVDGYVPLIGKDWVNDYVGKPYEPKNILTRRARISYVVSATAPSIFMCTGEPVESVEAVYRNGILLDPSDYYIDEGFQTVNVRGTGAGDRLEIYMTMKNGSDELRDLFLSAKRSVVFGGMENHRVFFWGSNDPSLLFCSSYVSREQSAASALHGNVANELYIPVGYEFRVGAVGHRIFGCACHYDKLLIYTENDTWMASSDVSGFSELSLSVINSEIGCATLDGVVSVGNHPISIGRHSLYRWHQEGDVPNRCNAIRVSEEIDGLLSPEDYSNSSLYYNSYRDELWLHNRMTGTVWIRSMTDKGWFRFSGVFADRIFDANGQVAFLRGSALYVFDDAMDYDESGENAITMISASYVGSLTDFGTVAPKNLSSITLRGDGGGGTLSLTFEEDGMRTRTLGLFTPDSPFHLALNRRLSSGRFRYGRLSLTADGFGKPIVHSLTLHTR